MTHTTHAPLKEYFNEEFITALSVHLDEPVPAVSRAIDAIIPTVMSAISIHARETGGRNDVLLREAALYYPKSPDVEALQNHWKGGQLPDTFFGGNLPAVTKHVAAYSGVRPASSGLLIMLVTPVVAGKLGERSGESNYLSPARESEAMVPEGYSLPDLTHHLKASKEDQHQIHQENKIRNRTNFVFPKWVPVAVIIAVVLLLIYFSRL